MTVHSPIDASPFGTPPLADGAKLTLRLDYRPPYDLAGMLAFLRGRALPGIERVDDDSYARIIAMDDTHSPTANGWLRLSAGPDGEPALKLELHCAQPARMQEAVTRLRRMFDLDADPAAIDATLSRNAKLEPLLRRNPGMRLP